MSVWRPRRPATQCRSRSIAGEAGLQGSVGLAADGTVRVTTSTSVDTVLLSLIGINTLPGHGSAEAQLHD